MSSYAATDPGPTADETDIFDRLATGWISLSAEIKRIGFVYGEDSTGDPAVWVRVVVSPDLNPSSTKIADLTRATAIIQRDILESGSARWPYVEIDTE